MDGVVRPVGVHRAVQQHRISRDRLNIVDGAADDLHIPIQKVKSGAFVEMRGREIARLCNGFIVDHMGDSQPVVVVIPGRVLVFVDGICVLWLVLDGEVRHDARILPVCVCLIETQGQGIRSIVIPGELVVDGAALDAARLHDLSIARRQRAHRQQRQRHCQRHRNGQ